MNVFYNTIVFVKDITISKTFYESVVGLTVEKEYETVVFFENHFVIHDFTSILQSVYGKGSFERVEQGRNNLLIYFETDNIELSYQHVLAFKAEIIHPIMKQEWGQHVFRFYDPDRHIIEIGEAIHLESLKSPSIVL